MGRLPLGALLLTLAWATDPLYIRFPLAVLAQSNVMQERISRIRSGMTGPASEVVSQNFVGALCFVHSSIPSVSHSFAFQQLS